MSTWGVMLTGRRGSEGGSGGSYPVSCSHSRPFLNGGGSSVRAHGSFQSVVDIKAKRLCPSAGHCVSEARGASGQMVAGGDHVTAGSCSMGVRVTFLGEGIEPQAGGGREREGKRGVLGRRD